jgi:tetratricopeptide (TPR) repeat protein
MEDTQLTMKQSQAVNPSMLALRGLIKIDHLDWEGAQRDIDQALRELPQSDLALMARAKLKNELGDYQGALVDANASIALSPGPGPYCQRGIARLSLGEIDGAMADFNGVITAEPTMGEAYRNRAAARCMKAELDGALADLEKAIQYEPKPADAFTMRGYVHFLLGHWDEAESDLGSSIRLAPPGNEAHRTRGWVRLAKRNWDGAEEDFQAAGQDDDAQLRWIWMSQARGGDPSAAARQLASTRKGGTSGESGAWSGLLTDFILGKRTQEEVLAASAADPSQAGQFWFFAGQLRLLAKDDAGAAEAFCACRAKSHSQSPEAQLAGVELSSGPGRE